MSYILFKHYSQPQSTELLVKKEEFIVDFYFSVPAKEAVHFIDLANAEVNPKHILGRRSLAKEEDCLPLDEC